jgi:hypothetical protein
MKQRGTKQKKKHQKLLHRIRQNNMNETVKEAKKSKRRIKGKSQEEKKTGCTRREEPKGGNQK